MKAVKEAESAKSIMERETAILNFVVQIYQKWTRHGNWQPVGNILMPLVKYNTQLDDDGNDTEETKIARGQVSIELSMAVTGILATSWVGGRESVVQAQKSRRSKLFEYYGWVAFVCYFLVGSFVNRGGKIIHGNAIRLNYWSIIHTRRRDRFKMAITIQHRGWGTNTYIKSQTVG